MSLDRRLRESAQESKSLYEDHPVPPFSPGRPTSVRLLAFAVIAVLAFVGISMLLRPTPDPIPPIDLISTTTRPAPTTTEASNTLLPHHLDDGRAVLDLRMEDGTRLAVLMPHELLTGSVSITTSRNRARIIGDGMEAELSLSMCASEVQDIGEVTESGAVVISGFDSVVVCRVNQSLRMDVTTVDPLSSAMLHDFDAVPIEIGPDYLGTIMGGPLATVCCDRFGPLAIGSSIVTAGGHTSAQITGWDPETLEPLWTVDLSDDGIFESAMLLGAVGDSVIVTSAYQLVRAYAAVSGESLWEVALSEWDAVEGTAIDAGILYLLTDDPAEGGEYPPRLRAIDTGTGEVLWESEGRDETVLQWAEPLVLPDLVVVMDVPRFVTSVQATNQTAHVIAFDRATGQQRWEVDLEDDCECFQVDLLASDPSGTVVVVGTPGNGEVFVIETDDGDIRWRSEVPSSNARIEGVDEVAVDLLFGPRLDLDTGTVVNP